MQTGTVLYDYNSPRLRANLIDRTAEYMIWQFDIFDSDIQALYQAQRRQRKAYRQAGVNVSHGKLKRRRHLAKGKNLPAEFPTIYSYNFV